MPYSTNYNIISAQTVVSNYSWDQGVPALSSQPSIPNSSNVTYISGYAPGVLVYFQNNSSNDDAIQGNGYSNQLTTYNWNFNDYYNISTNITSLTSLSSVSHTYIMPGIYRPSLQHIQTTLTFTDVTNISSCFGDYSLSWFWDNFNSYNTSTNTQNQPKAWDSFKTGAKYPKTWDTSYGCLQKYCSNWQWRSLGSNTLLAASNPITWSQAKSTGKYAKLWRYEPNNTVCQLPISPQNTATTVNETIFNNCTIQVIELPPIANMYCVNAQPPLTAINQITVQLTPRTSIAGSFPIDRIDWDMGDGTPTISVSRYSAPNNSALTFTNIFSADTNDVRNYDITHTFYRYNTNTYPVFYPSLTCYSANTNTSNSCCLTIGPVTLSSIPTNTHILKARNSNLGNNMYVLNVDNSAVFTTTATITGVNTQVIPNTPPSALTSSISSTVLYTGNPGNTSIV